MKSLRVLTLCAVALMLTAGMCVYGQNATEGTETAVSTPQKATTLDNLMAAYNGESNAHAKYVAFAAKADEEGYPAVAVLFRAAAKAEEIHAANHAAVITKMGGTPQADVKEPEVKSTKENLEAALAGETYEKDTMYPEFLALARADNNRDAMRTFNFAKSAEAEHAAFYKDALDNLETWKTAQMNFYVCPVCGKTITAVDFEKCPVCSTPGERFEKIS